MKGDGHSTCEHHCHNATETGFCDIAQNQKNTQKDFSQVLVIFPILYHRICRPLYYRVVNFYIAQKYYNA